MGKFEIGDRVQMPGVPMVVTVTGHGTCEDGDTCPLGVETFSFNDPAGNGEDWMHASEFEKAAGA